MTKDAVSGSGPAASDQPGTGHDGPPEDLLAPLARLSELPVTEHNGLYTELHDALLRELDSDAG